MVSQSVILKGTFIMWSHFPALAVSKFVEPQSPTTKIAIGIFIGAVFLVAAGIFL
jgi:hypothetical protein